MDIKHIKLYEEYTVNESENPMIGMVIHVSAYGDEMFYDTYYLCVVNSFWDAFEYVYREDFGYDDEDFEDAVNGMMYPGDLQDVLWNHAADNFNSVDDMNVTIWSGMNPKSNSEQLDSIYSNNPYVLTGALEKMFTNAKEIMLKNPSGDLAPENDALIANSVRNRPEKIAMYAEKDEELAKKIARNIGLSDDKLQSLIKYSNIKKQI